MELEVGMYARYDGKIGKITHICKCEQCEARGYYEPIIEYIHGDDEYVSCYFKNNLKASHNIIDLIQSKDLIVDTKNNLYVVDRVEGDYVFTTSKNEYGLIITLVDYQIKSIVTKEQFESMSYKVD